MTELTRSDVAELILCLRNDPSNVVRTRALRSLVRLPLSSETWDEVSDLINEFLTMTPVGDLFENQVIYGIKFREIIDAAIFIPRMNVRKSLQLLLDSEDVAVRSAVAHALAHAHDPLALPELIRELDDPGTKRRGDTAEQLSFVDVQSVRGEVYQAFQRERDIRTRFWLAFALALTGEREPIKQIIKELKKDPDLKKRIDGIFEIPGGIPEIHLFSEKLRLRQRRFLPEAAKKCFSHNWGGIYKIESLPEILVEIPGQRDEKGKKKMAGEARRTAKELLDLYEDNKMLDFSKITYEKKPALMYLEPSHATKFISKLFASWLRKDWPKNDHKTPFNNGIGEIAHDFIHPFVPNVAELFESYLTSYRIRRNDDDFHLRYRIAWVISRADLKRILSVIAPHFTAKDETERSAAALLIEEVVKWQLHSEPPRYGGDTPLGDIPIPEIPELPEKEHTKTPKLDVPFGNVGKFGDGTGFYRDRNTGALCGTGGKGRSRDSFPDDRNNAGIYEATSEIGNGKGSEENSTGTKPEHKRVVNTGFALNNVPDEPLQKTMPLKCGSDYFFLFDIGPQWKEGSIEKTSVDIPQVSAGAHLVVVLFGSQGGIEVQNGADTGVMEVQKDNTVSVLHQPLEGSGMEPESAYIHSRLFFPFRTPARSQKYYLRCNIYYQQLLLQSRLVEAEVVELPADRKDPQISSEVDYTLMQRFDTTDLRKLKEHRLSIFLNQSDDRTHTFYFFGEDKGELVQPAPVKIDRGDLKSTLETARDTLRKASWGTLEKWQKGDKNRYEPSNENRREKLNRLAEDLLNMAKWGNDFYSLFYQNQPEAFERLFSSPAYIQISIESSAKFMLPAAMIYDYPFDGEFKGPYRLCKTFEDAFLNLKPGESLEKTPCFQGHCETLKRYQELSNPGPADRAWVCPSGFWGFRHYLGMPLSVGKEEGDTIFPTIPFKDEMQVSVAFAQDLQKWEDHCKTLRGMLQSSYPGSDWNYAHSRVELLKFLSKTPHIVYFYCHGGEIRDKLPFLKIGPVSNMEEFHPGNPHEKILWNKTHPLVFLNGCHTAEIDPEDSFNLIDPFIKTSKSAGVIGTNITIFEEMATVFAKKFFEQFLHGVPIGIAVRNARISVLDTGDPMGLVYIPFVHAGLTLEKG